MQDVGRLAARVQASPGVFGLVTPFTVTSGRNFGSRARTASSSGSMPLDFMASRPIRC